MEHIIIGLIRIRAHSLDGRNLVQVNDIVRCRNVLRVRRQIADNADEQVAHRQDYRFAQRTNRCQLGFHMQVQIGGQHWVLGVVQVWQEAGNVFVQFVVAEALSWGGWEFDVLLVEYVDDLGVRLTTASGRSRFMKAVTMRSL